MNKFRSLFPIFQKRKEIVYLDSAGTSLKPQVVIDAVVDYYQKYSINTHSNENPLSFEVKKIVTETRKLIAQWINATIDEEIIFIPSATYGFNILALSLQEWVKDGDQICLSFLEHSSNYYPWKFLAQKKNAVLIHLPLNSEFIVDISKLSSYINHQTKILTITHLTNNLGIENPIESITKKVKEINPNCLIIVDACQSIIHLPVDVYKWNIDVLIFSGHKIYGPTGIGVMWMKKKLIKKFPDLLWGGGKEVYIDDSWGYSDIFLPQKFEVGTLPLAQIFGLKQSFVFLNSFNIDSKRNQEKKLWNYACQKLSSIKKITIYNIHLTKVSSIILWNFSPYHPHDVAEYLKKNNIFIRAGNFCSPLLNKLIKKNAALRISLSFYNNKKDIDILLYFLKKLESNPNSII